MNNNTQLRDLAIQPNPKAILALYLPVIHYGYIRLIEQLQPAEVWLFDESVIGQFDWLKRKDLRRLHPNQATEALQAVFPDVKIRTIDADAQAEALQTQTLAEKLYFPDEDITRQFVEQNGFKPADFTFISAHLRYDKERSLSDEQPVGEDSAPAEASKIMSKLEAIAGHSADWWRQVAGAVVKNNEVILTAWNHHLPDEYQTAYEGDPRGNFKAGQHIEISTAQHAEASLVARAAKSGIELAGADVYVTTFPCPVCARLLSETGIKRVFFKDGYSKLAGAESLEAAGITVHKV